MNTKVVSKREIDLKSNGVYIIAEAGVNHNGSLDQAKKMIVAAAQAGVEAVKFQTFRAERLVIRTAAKAVYQGETTGTSESQYHMLKKLELSKSDFIELKAYCGVHQVEFLSTPFDLTTIDLLADIGMKKWKLPSGEITNLPYLRKIGSFGQEVILSTGMSDIDEISAALSVLESAGTARSKITLLHCNTEYPTPMCDVNLRAMQTLRDSLPGLKGVGYSDHTLGIEVPIAAVAMCATVIEKHFTMDRSMPGPDHRASLEPNELVTMVRAIRNIETALGNSVKQATPSELKNKPVARKSIVAGKRISEGEVFTVDNLTVKRPGTGISPMRWDEIIGKTANRNYERDELIDA
jgi:N,N'-diacetyllegionaminate synthase